MNTKEFRRMKVGDEVYTHFSNAYRVAVVTAIEDKHLYVEGRAVNGGKLTRRAKYGSVDTRATGRRKLGMAEFHCEYCGGNDEDPQDHCMDCERPLTANASFSRGPSGPSAGSDS